MRLNDLLCLLGIHVWPKWSEIEILSFSYTIAGKRESKERPTQSRHCSHCNKFVYRIIN